MRRCSLLAVFVTLTSGCWFDEPNAAPGSVNGPGQTPPSQRSSEQGEVEVKGPDASKLSSLPLEGCERFDHYVDFARSTEKLARPLTEPEWQLHGYRIVNDGKRLTVAWAEGYGEVDETAAQPIAHPWWACFLPQAMTDDVNPISYSASPILSLSAIDLQLMDEGTASPKGSQTRREYATLVDTQSRTVTPRVLCRMESENGCSMSRKCEVEKGSRKLVAGAWSGRAAAACRPLLERYGKPNDLAVGPLGGPPPAAESAPSTLPGGWL